MLSGRGQVLNLRLRNVRLKAVLDYASTYVLLCVLQHARKLGSTQLEGLVLFAVLQDELPLMPAGKHVSRAVHGDKSGCEQRQ